MSDLIKRQDAIDAVRKSYDEILDFSSDGHTIADSVEDIINTVLSAQPSYTDVEIQKMQDLESAEIEKAYQLGYEEGKKDAQPERESIKWIPHKSVFGGLDERVYTCSKCGYNIGFHVENFCPNCGGKYER